MLAWPLQVRGILGLRLVSLSGLPEATRSADQDAAVNAETDHHHKMPTTDTPALEDSGLYTLRDPCTKCLPKRACAKWIVARLGLLVQLDGSGFKSVLLPEGFQLERAGGMPMSVTIQQGMSCCSTQTTQLP